MKYEKFNFYSGILTVTVAVLLASFAGCLQSCQFLPVAISDDWVYNAPPDDIPIDTLPLVVDTCTDYTLITQPDFVTLYILFDNAQSDILWQGGQVESNNLADVVAAVTSSPFRIDTHSIGASVIIEGETNHQAYALKIFAKADGAKWYFGSGYQHLICPGMEYDDWIATLTAYQSVRICSWWGLSHTYDQCVHGARTLLGDCKEGRDYADFFFMGHDLPETLLDSFELAGWDRIRHAPQPIYKLEFSACDITDEQLYWAAQSGKQIVVRE